MQLLVQLKCLTRLPNLETKFRHLKWKLNLLCRNFSAHICQKLSFPILNLLVYDIFIFSTPYQFFPRNLLVCFTTYYKSTSFANQNNVNLLYFTTEIQYDFPIFHKYMYIFFLPFSIYLHYLWYFPTRFVNRNLNSWSKNEIWNK